MRTHITARSAKIILVSALLLVSVLTNAQTFDSTWAAKFQFTLDSVVSAAGIRGASIAVNAPGMGTWHGVSGISTLGVPVTPDMEFGIGSNTKLFIAVLMMKLQEQGILSLDDHLYDWLPSFQYIDSSITVRQLLNHQAGVFDYLNDSPAFWNDSIWADTSRAWTDPEVLACIGPPNFSPGNGWIYSNTNYVLAGMIIEAATGQPWYQQLRTQVLNPLNLDSTFAGYYEQANGIIAHPLANDTLEIVNPPMTSEYSSIGAPGGVISNSSEMTQWYHALFTGQVISDSSLKQVLDFEPLSLYGLGLGEALTRGSPRDGVYYHTGLMLGYCSIIMFDSKTGSSLCVLTNNSVLGSQLFHPMMGIFINQFPARPTDAGISKVLSPYAQDCNAAITPQVVLTNYGVNTLIAATVKYSFDNGPILNYAWSGSLNTNDTAVITLPTASFSFGVHSLKCYTYLPNGTNDAIVFNDTTEMQFILSSTSQPAAYLQDFENASFPPLECSANPAAVMGWRRTALAYNTGHACMVKNNYNDPFIERFYDFDLPYLNLSSLSNPGLSFKYAYTYYPPPGFKDSLAVLISTDCGDTWNTLFYDGGNSLKTATPTSYLFIPNIAQWKNKFISLAGYSGDVIIRFRNINYSGNNLYIDNISVDNATVVNEIASVNVPGVYPNPFSETALLRLDHEITKGTLVVYDDAGREMQRINELNGNVIRIERKNLVAGFYIFNLFEDGFPVRTGKLMMR